MGQFLSVKTTALRGECHGPCYGGCAERNGSEYSPITAGSALAAGDRILLTLSVYPAGSTYQLIDSNGVLAAGTLQ